MRNLLWCYYRWFITSLALEKCEKEGNILKVILVQDICPLKIKITQFRGGFDYSHNCSYTEGEPNNCSVVRSKIANIVRKIFFKYFARSLTVSRYYAGVLFRVYMNCKIVRHCFRFYKVKSAEPQRHLTSIVHQV